MMASGFKKISWAEMQECCKAAATVKNGDNQVLAEVVIATFLRQRYGPCAGSTAANVSNGHSAIRYFDTQFQQLRWLVYTSPERQELSGERMDDLPGEGRGWKISERDWREVVYPK